MYTCNMLKTTEKYAQFLKTAYIFDNLICLFVISRQKIVVRGPWKFTFTAIIFHKRYPVLRNYKPFFCHFLPSFALLFVRAMHCKELFLQNYQFCKTDNVEQKNSVCAQNFFAQTWDEPIFVFPTLVHALVHGLRTHDD